MKVLATLASIAAVAEAHTLFTNFHVNGQNQGDGTCVRQPEDHKKANSPIYPLDGANQACGRNGEKSVPFVCPVKGGSTISFEYRLWPNGDEPGSIDESHKGPCSVYMKKMDNILKDSAAGDGWFKIWEDGYHQDTKTWCVDTLIKNNGLLSVDLPNGLPPGEYLIRPELLALHLAQDGDPQFYHGCAQIFIEDGPDTELEIPKEMEVSIPGYLESDDPGLTYNIYWPKDLPEYPIPGPKVFYPTTSSNAPKTTTLKQERGQIPSDCLIKNANWCAAPLAPYSTEKACWDSVGACYDQGEECWDSIPPSGYKNCQVWNDYCSSMNDECKAKKWEGPPEFKGEEVMVGGKEKGVPKMYGGGKGTEVGAEKGKKLKEDEKNHVEAPKEGGDNGSEGEQGGNEAPEDDNAADSPVQETPKESTPELKVSEDGLCGGETGQTCEGSTFGECCSKKGRCGRKTRHCACGCQSDFGECREKLR